MLGFVVTQKALVIAVEDRPGGDHLGVEQGVLGEQAQEVATVSVGPIHHGGDGEAAGEGSVYGGDWWHWWY